MNVSDTESPDSARPPIRVVTAASLFDGHDAAINIMRRLLQGRGAEVIHLGHDRGVEEIVEAVVEEAADAVAMGVPHVRVYGGGGGTITPDEIEALQKAGVARIFSPEDGRRMGLAGMIGSIVDGHRGRSGSRTHGRRRANRRQRCP